MFGLMSPPKNCPSSCNNLYDNHRKHYCGTCKTIGQHYGQSARMMLNFDAVFLGELLSLMSNDDTAAWQPALQTVNTCLTMPKKDSQDSIALKYAATTNVLLAELKIKDHVVDNGKKRWRLLNTYFSKSFIKAKRQLDHWGIDSSAIISLAKQQEQLEKQPTFQAANLEEVLTYYAAPTAEITAKVFENGAKIINKAQCSQQLYDLGYTYGQLAYVLDAFTDLELDIYNKEFNPIALFYDCKSRLSETMLEGIRMIIIALQNKVITLLQDLEIEAQSQESFTFRLESSIALEI